MKSIRQILAILHKINWPQTLYLYLRVKKPRSSSIRVMNRSILSLEKSAKIIMDEHSFLEINRQDYHHYRGVKSRLTLSSSSTLHICGSVSLHHGTSILLHNHASLTIGDHTYLNGASIDCSKSIAIGKECAIAGGVKILDNSWHSISNGQAPQRPVNIGNHVWIATNAIILPGVSLGDGCVVAAGSIVTHSIPQGALAAGAPAKVIRENVRWSLSLHNNDPTLD